MTVSNRTQQRRGSKTKGLRTANRILVSQLRKGHQIVTAWQAKTDASDLSEEEIIDVLSGAADLERRYVKHAHKVEKLEICPGQWRTHMHVNGKDCYDERTHVWVVNE